MPFEAKKEVFNNTSTTIEFGNGSSAIELGGENVWPLYSFDGALKNPPRVGIEVSDLGASAWDESLKSYYADCPDVGAMVKKAAAVPGAEFIYLVFKSSDPSGDDKDVKECAALAKEIADACPLPLSIAGSGNSEKDAELFIAVAEALQGTTALFLSAKEENYKAVGTGVALAWGQKVAAESSVDINLAKQLSLLMEQLGVPASSMAMNVGTAAAGYGFEYVASTMERIKSAALSQNDTALQSPIITPVGEDAWSTKEALASEADFPLWGSSEERGIQMEVVTAAASLAAGSDAVILRHPEAVSTVAAFIGELVEGGE